MSAPLSHSYNLARLGIAGDEVRIEADPDQCAAIAVMAQALALSRFVATVALAKTGPAAFLLTYRLEAEVTQACVVTLAPLASHIARAFSRELHFAGTGRRPAEAAGHEQASQEISLDEGEETEEIESLHYDLAGPLLEEFLLALDPYPRCPGVEFDPGMAATAPPESPFAALKSLKSSK